MPSAPPMVERARRSSGAALAACRQAFADGVAVNLAGGTHHAHRDHGQGYCVFNDAAVAARLMQAGRDAATPVLVVENASLVHEARVLTRLGDLATAVSALDGPAILIIGEVAALASDLAEILPELERAQA